MADIDLCYVVPLVLFCLSLTLLACSPVKQPPKPHKGIPKSPTRPPQT